MRKPFLHFIALTCSFFGVWLLISQVDFVSKLNIPQITKDNERKIGEFILESVYRGNDEIKADPARAFIARLKERICRTSGIADSAITLHILIKDDVNAFGLPGRHLIINTGLIRYCHNPEELSGVIAHEIAHIEHNHVMKKLAREVGISMLTGMAGGESSVEIRRQTLKLLSSTAFDRNQERDADLAAVHMLSKAEIDPEHLANLLFRLSREKENIATNFEWLNTHPNAQDRAAEILKLRKKEKHDARPIANAAEWKELQAFIEEAERHARK